MNKPILLLFLFTLFLKPTAKAQQQHKKQAHPSPQLNTRHAVPNLKALGNKLSQRKPIDPCGTVDYMNSIRQNNPKWESIDHFETWLSKNIQEKQQKGSTAIDGMVIEIPYVVHIIHDGTPINAVGQVLGYNISAAQVASQIRVLNEDFSLTNPDRANSPQWDDRAANLGIKFVPALYHPDTGIPLEEPGINRIDRNAFGFEPAPYETAYIETTIKPATAWNREDVINIWVMPLPLGLYGYAQFPSSSTLTGLEGYNGNSNTDGVVIAPFTFGSYADQDGSFITAQTQFGRTTTHEIGHWCGFRHIWGDGDCTQDDFVVDTPPQNGNSPFGSCNNGQNSCYDPDYGDYTTDLPDMKENFMDYSGDQCMNLFTKGQLARAEIVFDKSPGRGSLIHSTVDSLKKPILFMAPSSLNKTVDVNATCETYKEYKFDIRVAYNYTGSGSIKAQLKSIGGTAKLGEDYDIIGANEVTFTGGQAETQSVVIRVYNDINEENDESIDFELELIDASDTNVTLTDNSDFKTTSWLIKNASREEQIATISLLDDTNTELICFDNETLDLTIQFDSNPEETSWQIRNDQNQLVRYGRNYTSEQTSITEQINLPDGQYTFQIFDSGDNGLCCSTLDGIYSLSTKSGIILASGARFKNQESTSFCLGAIQAQQPIVIGRNAQVAEDVHCDGKNSLYYINAKINKCTVGNNQVVANIVVDGGSAQEGEDFIFPEKTFTFNGNEEQIIPISIEILNDAEAELIEDVTFHLEITNNDYAQIDSTA